MKNWLVLAVVAVVSFAVSASERAEEAWELIEQGAVIIDVRTVDEFRSGHVADAYNLNYSSIASTIGSLKIPTSKPIVVYCRSGNRSGIAEQTLSHMGYTVHNGGGLNELIGAQPQ